MDIGLAEATVAQLYDHGLLNNIADFYSLKKEQLIDLERFAEKSAENLIVSIEDSKNIPFHRVLYALGIRYVGETVAKTLASEFQSIETLENATVEQLVSVNEIGERIAESIVSYFSESDNRECIRKLKENGLQFKSADNKPQGTSLSGKSLIISGVFSKHSRNEIKDMIEQHGGKNVSSISAKTDYLVAGENIGPSKLEKAQKLNIPIISEEDFLNLLKNN
jgi:DNA ligase (NAD+)